MTPAAQARHNAGLSVEQAAQRARVCTPYLRRIEKHGGAPYVLAVRLAHIYGCRADVFLPTETDKRRTQTGATGRPKAQPAP